MKSYNQIFVVVTVSCITLAFSASGLICNFCHSVVNGECKENPSPNYAIECLLSGVRPDLACYQIQYYSEPDDYVIVERGCWPPYSQPEADPDLCTYVESLVGENLFHCSKCTEDYCNSTPLSDPKHLP